MAKLDYQIGALWMEGPLSFMEQLCLKSFVDAGHHVTLYHYGPLQNVPNGIELTDANEILPAENFLLNERTGSPALHSDLFRYKLLEIKDRMIWADTDAYCVKPFETENGHFYGWESEKRINGGVLGLPKDSATLEALLEFTKDEFSIPPWYGPGYIRVLEEARDAGKPVHVSELPWGVWGPHALTHFLHVTGEAKYALPTTGLYPFPFAERRKMMRPGIDTGPYITDDTYSVHFYGRRIRAGLREKYNGIPEENSLIGRLLKIHKIDPLKAPIPGPHKPAPEENMTQTPAIEIETPAVTPVPAAEKAGRGVMNLTDLADKYGSDKGSRRHRYSELYQMLFLPFRERKIEFLEMGLLIGGPEQGFDASRVTEDLPSIRMWLEFFRKAQIHGLDVSDFSWFKDDRFTFHQCDMDDRANITAAAQNMPELDIVVDDASHASHHQQFGFMELFPQVKSGGLYIIEDLRWQPETFERKGITRTDALFYEYQRTGVFTHSDPEVAAEMNALRHDISGVFMFQHLFDKRRRDQVVVVHKR